MMDLMDKLAQEYMEEDIYCIIVRCEECNHKDSFEWYEEIKCSSCGSTNLDIEVWTHSQMEGLL